MEQVKKDIQYINKDFSQYRASLIEFAKNYFPNTYNDFNEASPGMMMIELASYVGDVLSYYTDNQLKETLLDQASYKPDLLNLAANVGYKIKNTIPATVTLDIFQLLPAKSSITGQEPDWDYALTVDAGMQVATDSNVIFRTLDLVNFKVSSSFDTTEVSVYSTNASTNLPEFYLVKKKVKAIAGTLKVAAFTFESPKRYDKILIQDTDIIDVVSIVDSDNNEWTEVPYLAQDTVFETIANTVTNDPELSQYSQVPYLMKLRKTARRFITKFRADKNLEIQFGAGISTDADEELIPNPDNVGSSLIGLQTQFDHPIDPSNFMYTKTYGLAPSNTTLTVIYTVGGGVLSNVPAFSLNTIANISFQIDDQQLNPVLLQSIKASVATTNPEPASGGKSEESLAEIRQNAMASFASQQRMVTDQDYVIRAYSMPSKFGSVAKAYVIPDQQLNLVTNQVNLSNPLAINLYTLGYDVSGNLTQLNAAVKENLKTYLNAYRILTDAINIKDAFIINIGIRFEIITFPEYNSNEVLLQCVNSMKNMFNITKWQINQPIVISKIYTELDKIPGVQTVKNVEFVNLYKQSSGYSGNVYDIASATKNGIIYPSLDPSIFEIKYPNQDIIGKVVSF